MAAKRYLWEAKPPIPRSDVFSDGWEVGERYFENDERAAEWAKKMFDRHNVAGSFSFKISVDGRVLRHYKSS